MAFASDLTPDAPVPSALWEHDLPAPKLIDVLTQVAHFLDQLGFTTSFTALHKEAKKNGLEIDIAEWEHGIEAGDTTPFLELFAEYHRANDGFPTLPASSEPSSDSEDSPDDKSSSSADGAAPTGAKRKRALTPSSSESSEDDSSESDDDSSSDESDAAPPTKKVKTVEVDASSESESESESQEDGESDSDTTSDASSDSDESDEDTPASENVDEEGASSSSSASSNDSDDDSDSTSDSSSSGSSSDDSEAEAPKSLTPSPKKKKKTKAPVLQSIEKAPKATASANPLLDSKDSGSGSQSSVTLEAEPQSTASQVHPDRLKRMPPLGEPSRGGHVSSNQEPAQRKQEAALRKQQSVPFSRIPTNQAVDPRFASNAYVSYDYADRAHQDLVVTKGKGFTKEKNKKKRGSYRGGMIDMTPKGIKFDD